ncbi:PRC-barrel domain-containing protein [Candidatus Pacearchaeota archaeon]|nr:PRC-barrel domain-containing protein [Candidatus Pacearchaeota archaeon]
MLKIKKISEVFGRNVYTDAGDFLGQVEEANISENKIDGWRIRISGSTSQLIGGARGIIIPHQFVRAMGDIVIVNKSSLPIRDEIDAEQPIATEETAEI